MAGHILPIQRHICDAVIEHSNIASQSLAGQWGQLVLRPLLKLDSWASQRLNQEQGLIAARLDEATQTLSLEKIRGILCRLSHMLQDRAYGRRMRACNRLHVSQSTGSYPRIPCHSSWRPRSMLARCSALEAQGQVAGVADVDGTKPEIELRLCFWVWSSGGAGTCMLGNRYSHCRCVLWGPGTQ